MTDLPIRNEYVRLRDDEYIDEVRLAAAKPGRSLRLITVPRYKTSGLSGDEWRTSVMWQFERRAQRRHIAWDNFDGPYSKLPSGCAALYPGIFSSHEDRHDDMIERVEFYRKGRLLWSCDDAGRPATLLHTAASLPWANVLCSDQPIGFDGWEEKCFQPGCSEDAISTYRLIERHDRRGEKRPSNRMRKFPKGSHILWDARRFCARHLRRGDCGLDDADRNYEVVEGPGPDKHETAGGDVKEAAFGGVVEVEL